MAIQTLDNSFEFTTDEAVQASDSFDQSFDSVDSRDSVPEAHDDSLELSDINITVPNIPPTPPTLSQEIPAQEEGKESLNDDCDSGPQQEEETAIEPPGSATDDLTIIDSVESLRSLDEVPDAEPLELETEAPVNEFVPASESSEPHNLSTSTAGPETTDNAETKESLELELSHGVDVSSTDAIDDESRLSEIDKQAMEAALPNKEAKLEGTQTEPQPPTAYTPYDDELGDMSFDMFNVPYFKATVVALAASGLGVMLANGVYRLFRT